MSKLRNTNDCAWFIPLLMSDVSLVLTGAWTRCSRWRWWTWSPASCSPTSPGELWLADTEYSPLIGPQPAAGVHHHGPQPGARPAAPRGGGQQQRAERGHRPRGVHHQGGAATSRWVLRDFFSCLKGVWVILVHSLLMIQLKMVFSIVSTSLHLRYLMPDNKNTIVSTLVLVRSRVGPGSECQYK